MYETPEEVRRASRGGAPTSGGAATAFGGSAGAAGTAAPCAPAGSDAEDGDAEDGDAEDGDAEDGGSAATVVDDEPGVGVPDADKDAEVAEVALAPAANALGGGSGGISCVRSQAASRSNAPRHSESASLRAAD